MEEPRFIFGAVYCNRTATRHRSSSSLFFGECALLVLYDVDDALHVSEEVRPHAVLAENVQDLQ
jgi:hypothetical protein